MDWSKQVFNYCERGLDGALWAEPLNALTNAAFGLAAAAAFVLWLSQNSRNRRWVDLTWIVLVFAIGTGSFLFHTFATRWALLADVLPIMLFMVTYLGYALRRFLGWSWLGVAIGLALFAASLYYVETLKCDDGPCLNGSIGYLPALAAMLVVGAIAMASANPSGKLVFSAGLVFAVSLTARTLDMDICTSTGAGAHGPFGTHFLWHCLNALLLYLLMRAAICYGDFEERAIGRSSMAVPTNRN